MQIKITLNIISPYLNEKNSKLEDALSDKTKAVMIAHTLGNPFDLKEVRAFCDKHNLWLVEDNCDALGSEYTIDGETRLTGAWGDIATSSFYPPHHITMGEGGCVYTNNGLLHRLVRSFRDWGRDCVCPPGKDNFCGHRFDGQFGKLPVGYDHKYVYSHLGYNLKATDMQAAVGCAQLDKLIPFADARRKNWDRFKANLQELSDVLELPERAENSNPSWFGFIMCVKEGASFTRNDITKALEENNIQTRLLFSGNLIKHPCFDEYVEGKDYRVVGSLDVTDRVMNNAFWIGVYPGLTDEKIDFVSDVIKKACGR